MCALRGSPFGIAAGRIGFAPRPRRCGGQSRSPQGIVDYRAEGRPRQTSAGADPGRVEAAQRRDGARHLFVVDHPLQGAMVDELPRAFLQIPPIVEPIHQVVQQSALVVAQKAGPGARRGGVGQDRRAVGVDPEALDLLQQVLAKRFFRGGVFEHVREILVLGPAPGGGHRGDAIRLARAFARPGRRGWRVVVEVVGARLLQNRVLVQSPADFLVALQRRHVQDRDELANRGIQRKILGLL